MVMGNLNLPFGTILQSQIMFNDASCRDVIQMLMLQKDWRDCSMVFRFQGAQGQGIYTGTFMQSITKKFQVGLQANLIPAARETSFGYCAYYQTGEKMAHQFSASYVPMQQRESINLSYVGRPSQRLQLFSELKGKLDGSSSEFLGGFKMRFMEGAVTGYLTS
mmetsp:Transcript_9377/g.14273  ORF Transcript_9377/g.14273 Transcript_9377/m.14273 type:complete len:163 (+) Transcript_9377:497-985(+)